MVSGEECLGAVPVAVQHMEGERGRRRQGTERPGYERYTRCRHFQHLQRRRNRLGRRGTVPRRGKRREPIPLCRVSLTLG
jgi:hypothetical protein